MFDLCRVCCVCREGRLWVCHVFMFCFMCFDCVVRVTSGCVRYVCMLFVLCMFLGSPVGVSFVLPMLYMLCMYRVGKQWCLCVCTMLYVL